LTADAALPCVVTPVDSPGAIVNSQAQASPSHRQPVWSIELHTPARTVVIPVIRTIAADLAARAGFELDSIDDLRMAVDDACAMLVHIAAQGATLSCRLTVRPERIEAVAEVDVEDGAQPLPIGSFGWRVLECLAEEVKACAVPAQPGQRGRVRITLGKQAVTALPGD
jgi:serine/threonine-protein kinase RsbW